MNWSAFKRARGYVSPERWRLLAAGACAVVSGVGYVAMVVLLGLLGEVLFTPWHTVRPPEVGPELAVKPAQAEWYGPAITAVADRLPLLRDSVFCLVALLAAALLLAGVRAVCQYLQSLLVARAVADATHRLRRAIYRQAYRLGTTEMSGIGAAPAVNVFTRDTDAVRDGLMAWFDSSVREPVKLVLLLTVAIMAHWSVAVLFLVLAGLGAFLAPRLITRVRARAAAATRKAAERLALLQESLFMLRLTRGYSMESYEQHRFERNLGQFTLGELRQLRSPAAVDPLFGFFAILGVTIVGGLASYKLVLAALSPSSTVVLYASLVCLYFTADLLLRRYREVRDGAEAATAVFTFLDQQTQLGQVENAGFLPPMSKSLEFAQVRVQEPGQPPVLDALNLTIRAGSRTAILGLDEQAKCALIYLIPRFLDPTDGRVRIDGQDIKSVTLESLRAQVALVMQGELVFQDTVAANIGGGDQSYGLPHIVDAAKIAHAHHFVQRLPKGYDTIIGDSAERLTLGEQFRIALARAILRDPTIVVIEEPRASLDEDTKHLLDDTMTRFCPGRTVLFLPHRLSTIRSCDQIVIVHNGKIETIGNHRELTLTSELYRHLQYTEFNVFAAG